MSTLDSTDLNILKALEQNAKLTMKELGEKVHLSPTPVFERVKRLEKDGYIEDYVALLDKKKLGYHLIVICNLKLKEHTKAIGEQVVRDLQKLKEVKEILNISGDFDFMLKVIVKDMPEYQHFILNRLGQIKNIGSTQSIFVLGEIKNTTEIL